MRIRTGSVFSTSRLGHLLLGLLLLGAYDWTHHNWNDSAEVDVAANLRFVFEVTPGRGAVTFENLLTRVDDEGAVLAGPFSLEHQGGSPWP